MGTLRTRRSSRLREGRRPRLKTPMAAAGGTVGAAAGGGLMYGERSGIVVRGLV